MENTREPTLEELTALIDPLACEYVRTNEKRRRNIEGAHEAGD